MIFLPYEPKKASQGYHVMMRLCCAKEVQHTAYACTLVRARTAVKLVSQSLSATKLKVPATPKWRTPQNYHRH